MKEDLTGKLTGGTPFNFVSGDNATWNGRVNATGTVKCSGTVTLVAMTILASGTGGIVSPQTGNMEDATLSYTIKWQAEIDESRHMLVLSKGSQTSVLTDLNKRKKTAQANKYPSGSELGLPASATGGWRMMMNLSPMGSKYTGAATVQTSAGESTQLIATGSFDARTNDSKINLKGPCGSLGLVFSTQSSNVTIKSAKGKLFGQGVNYTK